MGETHSHPVFYPISLQIRGKRIIIVGGGKVAERKLKGLLEGGADNVTLVSPHAVSDIEAWAAEGKVSRVCREFADSDLEGAFLAFAAAGDESVNEAVAAAAERLGILCNRADAGDQSDFMTSAVVRRGELAISITAGGASPALAGIMARRLAAQCGEEAVPALRRLKELRLHAKLAIESRKLRHDVLRLAAEEAADDWSNAKPAEEWLKALLIKREGRLDCHE